MTRKQRGVEEREPSEKVDNFDSSKGRHSKKRKYRDKQLRLWMW